MDFSTSKLVFLLGKQGSGKSNTIKWIITKNLDKFNFGIVFTGSSFDRKDYSYIPKKYVIQGYNEDILKKYLKSIEQYVEKYGSAPLNFVVFDDLLMLLSRKDKFFINFLGNMRHYNSVVLFAQQVIRSSGIVGLRELTHYAIVFKTTRYDTLKAIYEEFGTLFPSFSEFKAHFSKVVSEPFSAMLYDRNKELNENYLKFEPPDMSLLDVRLKY